MIHEAWFVLPPSMEKYYKLQHPDYKEVPLLKKECAGNAYIKSGCMELIYPQNPTRIYLPKDLQGKKGSTVFELTHRNLSATIYWHLDKEYIGSTRSGMHQMSLHPQPGKHKLTVVDDAGELLEQYFEIVADD